MAALHMSNNAEDTDAIFNNIAFKSKADNLQISHTNRLFVPVT